MTIECPICGQQTSVSQFDFYEDACFNCLQKIDTRDYSEESEENYDRSFIEED